MVLLRKLEEKRMSKLSQLVGKSKEYEIGGLKLDFQPLTVKDMDLFVKMEDENKKAHAITLLIKKTLKIAVPDATDEEIDNIGFENLEGILEAILDVNGMKDKKKGAFLEKIRNAQSNK